MAGANLWGGRDLEGPQATNLSLWHYLDFSPVAIQTGPAALYCYPNPAADAAAVRLSRPVAGTLLDALDHTVYQLPTATDCLDVRGLPAGLYLLRATDGATSRLLVRQTNRIVAQNFPLVLC